MEKEVREGEGRRVKKKKEKGREFFKSVLILINKYFRYIPERLREQEHSKEREQELGEVRKSELVEVRKQEPEEVRKQELEEVMKQ